MGHLDQLGEIAARGAEARSPLQIRRYGHVTEFVHPLDRLWDACEKDGPSGP
jgi:hypothetical protein